MLLAPKVLHIISGKAIDLVLAIFVSLNTCSCTWYCARLYKSWKIKVHNHFSFVSQIKVKRTDYWIQNHKISQPLLLLMTILNQVWDDINMWEEHLAAACRRKSYPLRLNLDRIGSPVIGSGCRGGPHLNFWIAGIKSEQGAQEENGTWNVVQRFQQINFLTK